MNFFVHGFVTHWTVIVCLVRQFQRLLNEFMFYCLHLFLSILHLLLVGLSDFRMGFELFLPIIIVCNSDKLLSHCSVLIASLSQLVELKPDRSELIIENKAAIRICIRRSFPILGILSKQWHVIRSKYLA